MVDTGKRLALLIGCQVGKLTGCDLDVARMATALGDLGFETRSLVQQQATRAGILEAYDDVIARAGAGDAVCIYYSGHGSRLENPDFTPTGDVPQYLQYLIPVDDSEPDFRGIMSFELSRRLARLTQKTHNVTVILDCCHSGGMSRAALRQELVPKLAPPRVTPVDVRRLLDADPESAALVDPLGNPYAVRLVAAEAETPAFEHMGMDGERTGVLTEALLLALAELGDEVVSWHALGLRVRELVMKRVPDQRPEVEGPRSRRLWSVEEAPASHAVSLFFKKNQAWLRAGWLQGARPGAEYGVMPVGSQRHDPKTQLAKALVVENVGALARVDLEPPGAALVAGQPAFPLKLGFEKRGVVLGAGVPDELRQSVAESSFVTAAQPDSRTLQASVELEDGLLTLRDPLGDVLVDFHPSKSSLLVRRLESIARADELRQGDAGTLRVRLRIEFGRVQDGKPVAMKAGDTFYEGDRLYLVVQNVGFQPLYGGLLNIDACYTITLLTRLAPQGVLLEPNGQPLYVGRTEQSLKGLPACWPDGLSKDPRDPQRPNDRARQESLLVIASADQQDFQLLESEPTRGGGERPGDFSITRIDYLLSPGPRPQTT